MTNEILDSRTISAAYCTKFDAELQACVEHMQENENLEVEVQFSTSVYDAGICYSALVIGRGPRKINPYDAEITAAETLLGSYR